MKLLPPQVDRQQPEELIELGPAQRTVVERVVAGSPVVSVVGAPGTGKTTLVIELVRALVAQGVPADRIMVLGASRRAAGELRNAVTARLTGPVQGAMVRTPAALAFSILAARAAAHREPIPRLITGPEQDQLLAGLLEGYRDGVLASPQWPASIPQETLGLRGFRAELRDLLMRAAENGLGPDDLEQLGIQHDRAEWQAAAHVQRDYQLVTQYATLAADAGRRYDPAQIVDDGAAALATWDQPDRPSWEVVIVDDYQEATAATARLLTVMRKQGARLVLVGDPDMSVQGFRGARPTLIGRATAGDSSDVAYGQDRLGEFGAEQFVLDTVHRGTLNCGERLRATVAQATRAIASVGVVSHRNAKFGASEGSVDTGTEYSDAAPVDVAILESEALESAFIARLLRSAHLREGYAWTDMAVIARSGSQLLALRRSLAQSGVPVAVVGTDIPLRDEPAVRPLLMAVSALFEPLEIGGALDLLSSSLGGADAIAIRKIRRALRGEELRGGGGRTSDELILEALSNADWSNSLGPVGAPLARVARVLSRGREAANAPGATPQTVLWAIWDASGLAELWQRTALSGSAASARADRDLDAVMALFRAAETYVDRLPESSAQEFVAFINSQDIPADSLTQQVALGGKVSLVTPAGAAGREWKIVVVAGVQEGQWPDLRLRDSLLGAQTLVEVISGRSADARGLGSQARREVFYDELRAFALAVSRASHRLVVTCVSDDEYQPSVFLDLVSAGSNAANSNHPDGREPDASEDESRLRSLVREARVSDIPLDLRGLTALVRAELVGGLEHEDVELVSSRASMLRYLAERGVPSADPSAWYGALAVSSAHDLYEGQDLVPLSPSRVESVSRCALRWSLESAGGSPSAGLNQSVGTLIHAIAADHPNGRLSDLVADLDTRWPQLRLPDGWPARRQYELARKMLEKLADYYRISEGSGVRDVLVEQPFRVEVEGARINGIADRVELLDNGKARIVDLKTGKSVPSKEEASTNPQLGIYQLALLDGAFAHTTESDGAALVYVASQTKSVTTREQNPIEDLNDNWAREVVRDAVSVMRSNTFVAQPNAMCPMCPVRRSCPITNEGAQVIPLGMPQTRAVEKESKE